MTRYLFQPQYFECKQADIEQLNNKVSKKIIVLKNPAQEEGVERVLFIWFSYTRSIEGVQFGIYRVITCINKPHICFVFYFSFT